MDLHFSKKEYISLAIGLLFVVLLSQSTYLKFLMKTILGRVLLLGVILMLFYTNKNFGIIFVLLLVLIVSSSGFTLIEGAENMNIGQNIMDKLNSTDSSSTTTSATTAPSSTTTSTTTTAPSSTGTTTTTDFGQNIMDRLNSASTSADTSTGSTSTGTTSTGTTSTGTTSTGTTSTSTTPAPMPPSGSVKNCLEILNSGDTTNPDYATCQQDASQVQQKVQAKKQEIEANQTATSTNTATEGFDVIGLERRMQSGKNSNSIPVYVPKVNDDFNVLPNDVGSFFGFSSY